VQIATRRQHLDLESTSQHAPCEVKEGLWAPTRLQAGNLTAIKSISQQLYCSDSLLLLRHQSKKMAPTTRAGSPTKGKTRATTEASEYDDQEESRLFEQAPETPSGGAADEDTPLMRQANMMALKRSQALLGTRADEQAKEIKSLGTALDKILAILEGKTPDKPIQSKEAPIQQSQRAATQERNPSATPGSEGSQTSTFNYKPKVKDPPRFANNDGTLKYSAWKDQILDKFEIDAASFTTEREAMLYLFGRTEGDAQDHLHPRHTRDPDNTNPYSTLAEMWETLDAIYVNPHLVRDSKNAYKELKMSNTQSFNDFKTKFVHLANAGRVPLQDRFDDMYDKLTIGLQSQLLNQRHLLGEDFQKLCNVASGIDVELKRLNQRRVQDKEARLALTAPRPGGSRQPGSFVPVKREFPNRPGAFTGTLPGTSGAFVPLQRPGGLPNRQPGVLPIAPIQPIKCFNCGEAGHISKECTKPRNSVNDIEEGEPEFEEDEGAPEDSGKADA
jgi:hypothetical protein